MGKHQMQGRARRTIGALVGIVMGCNGATINDDAGRAPSDVTTDHGWDGGDLDHPDPPDTGADVAPGDVVPGDATPGDVTVDAIGCALGRSRCGGACVDLATDPTNCGACGSPCLAGQDCARGACACPSGHSVCAGRCVDLLASTAHCGRCDLACTGAAHATSVCASGVCRSTCDAGFGDCDADAANGCEADLGADPARCGACDRACGADERCALGVCAPLAPPRPLAPLSTATVTTARPTLRWALAPGTDGARVELCYDRACTRVVRTLDAPGAATTLAADLPVGVVYWRLSARRGERTVTPAGRTWQFHVGVAPGPAPRVATSWGTTFDVNGDGYADLVVGAPLTDSGGRYDAGRVLVYHGGPTGIAALPDRILEGDSVGEALGFSVASAGDVNGDGYADLIVGAHRATLVGRRLAGRAYVFHGGAAGIGATPAHTFDGEADEDFLGFSVASAGDVNGDGYADVIVGAPYADPGGWESAGRAYVYLGSATGLGATPVRVVHGQGTGHSVGLSVASAGDVNGDGYGDVAVSATGAGLAGRRGGLVYVFHGGAAGIGTTPDRTLEGADTPEGFGQGLACAGDVNGDGYADLVVGAFAASPGNRDYAGRVLVYHGSATGLGAVAARTFEGELERGFLGWHVAGAGDVNGDGYADIALGARQVSRVYVHHGSAAGIGATAARTLIGTETSSFGFGTSVAGAGDLNGDGHDDLVVGASGAAPEGRSEVGRAYVFHGSTAGIGAAPIRTVDGEASGDALGYSVASRSDGVRGPPSAAVCAARPPALPSARRGRDALGRPPIPGGRPPAQVATEGRAASRVAAGKPAPSPGPERSSREGIR
jgi:hypothetical protein